MIVLQSLHSFGFVDMFGVDYWWVLEWVNWFPLFMILVGFSLGLSFKRREGFVKRNVSRGVLLIVVGGLLCWFKGWMVFDEALSGIGLSIILILPFFHFVRKKIVWLWFVLAGLSFLSTWSVFGFGAFNPFWLMSFMFVGVGFCGLFEP